MFLPTLLSLLFCRLGRQEARRQARHASGTGQPSSARGRDGARGAAMRDEPGAAHRTLWPTHFADDDQVLAPHDQPPRTVAHVTARPAEAKRQLELSRISSLVVDSCLNS